MINQFLSEAIFNNCRVEMNREPQLFWLSIGSCMHTKVNSIIGFVDIWLIFLIQHAPGVPKILVGNRLHLAYKRQVTTENAQAFAERLGVTFFEVSPLCNFNITESFTELARIVLMRHGMERLWRPNKGIRYSLRLFN